MTSPLAALSKAYSDRLQWTLSLPHLGIPGCKRHTGDRSRLPEPQLADINTKTKEPNVLCIEIADENGEIDLIPLFSPCSYAIGGEWTKKLVRSGFHPFDIVIATLDLKTIDGRNLRKDADPVWTFKTSVEWMYWTHEDQQKLDGEMTDGAASQA